MSKVVFISEEIKNLLIDNPAYCTIDEMKTIVSDYNSDSGISKNDIFILGYNLSMVRRDLASELSITGKSIDRLKIDGIDTLVKSIFTVDHETSLHLQNSVETHYYKLSSFGRDGFSIMVDIEIGYGQTMSDSEIIKHSVDVGLLSSEDERRIEEVEEIERDEFWTYQE